jgi:hypothetical protein
MVIAVRSWGDLRRPPNLGVVALIVLSLAACSHAATAPASSTPVISTVTATPGPTATASPAPILPIAARQPTRPGAEAFFRHFMAVYTYAFRVLDPAQLQAVSDQHCKFCASAIESVQAGRAKGEKTVGGRIAVTVAVAGPGDATDRLIVNALLNQDPGQTVSANREVLVNVPARKNFRLDAAVRWENDHWVFLNAHILLPGES